MRVRTGRFEKLRSTESGYPQFVGPSEVQHAIEEHSAVAPPAAGMGRHICRYIGRSSPLAQFGVKWLYRVAIA
jgi:hypothetical protein